MKEFLLKTFLNNTKNIKVSKAKGIKIYSTNKKVYTDFTGGLTGHAILGWGNKKIIDKIKQQINKFHHVDYKVLMTQIEKDWPENCWLTRSLV